MGDVAPIGSILGAKPSPSLELHPGEGEQPVMKVERRFDAANYRMVMSFGDRFNVSALPPSMRTISSTRMPKRPAR